jgi:hypothetical protein
MSGAHPQHRAYGHDSSLSPAKESANTALLICMLQVQTFMHVVEAFLQVLDPSDGASRAESGVEIADCYAIKCLDRDSSIATPSPHLQWVVTKVLDD